jgi:hypothetical protein
MAVAVEVEWPVNPGSRQSMDPVAAMLGAYARPATAELPARKFPTVDVVYFPDNLRLQAADLFCCSDVSRLTG